MNVPIVAGDIVDDGGFARPRFVRAGHTCLLQVFEEPSVISGIVHVHMAFAVMTNTPAEYRYSAEEPFAFPVDRANDATARLHLTGSGGGGGSESFQRIPTTKGQSLASSPTARYARTCVNTRTCGTRQGHGSKSEFGHSWFALANGRDADTSGHKTSEKVHHSEDTVYALRMGVHFACTRATDIDVMKEFNVTISSGTRNADRNF
ncbi:hypothetical protein DMN91_001652 [Ooceraea biroi]|uniref:Uncharacterized protein n=1 Tax=Ooceraea biroi TaxID=2015173 RepID=A0A3L8DYS0_OOCBI|nr:hypothetical protein DMN91_001652 [Ooceraea biroi]